MLEMVVGFVFDTELKNVFLIKKNRPEWQDGLINGIGGKIEGYESPYKAMVREFQEETGQSVSSSTNFRNSKISHFVETFQHYVTINGPGWRVYYFTAIVEPLHIYENPTDEELLIVPVRDLPKNTVFNLNWLIPLALDDDMMRPIIFYDKTKYVGIKKVKVWED